MPSAEQQALIEHPADAHGVVLAGPGTGKSTTVLQLVARLADEQPDARVKVITFTRAATAELVAKIAEEGHGLVEPSTVHAFALSLLMRNPGHSGLPEPLRIPDDWETKKLLLPDLSRRLRAAGWSNATPTLVRKLIAEMAAGWEKLDEDTVLLTDLDPRLRGGFRAAWGAQRQTFGYSLFAEMPFRARAVLDDLPAIDLGGLTLLVVDEFQDLNRADIELVEAVAGHGVAVLAVGDDDQSIYSWRFASPDGIRNFPANPAFPDARRYTLSTSYRCGAEILAAARELIEASPTRPPKPALLPGPGNAAGTVAYLRFRTEQEERQGVVDLVRYLTDPAGQAIAERDIVVLVRGDARSNWSRPLRDALTAAGVTAVDVESVLEPLVTDDARRLLALARVFVDPEDDLAWWGLLTLERGVGEGLAAAVADAAAGTPERFNSRLLRLASAPLPAGSGSTTASTTRAIRMVERILDQRDRGADLPPPDPDRHESWADWLIRLAILADMPLAEELRDLLVRTGDTIAAADGLAHFLNALEPAAKDLALDTSGVAIMSMSRSKGLTRAAAILMGVEDDVIPRPEADEEEERRLLYVAMTRARAHLYLTMATTRVGPTAFAGGGNAGRDRSRCRFFVDHDLRPQDGARYIATLKAGS